MIWQNCDCTGTQWIEQRPMVEITGMLDESARCYCCQRCGKVRRDTCSRDAYRRDGTVTTIYHDLEDKDLSEEAIQQVKYYLENPLVEYLVPMSRSGARIRLHTVHYTRDCGQTTLCGKQSKDLPQQSNPYERYSTPVYWRARATREYKSEPTIS